MIYWIRYFMMGKVMLSGMDVLRQDKEEQSWILYV